MFDPAVVVVGNIIFDFDYEMMARVLKVPSEKFRDKLYQNLHSYLTTIKKELGYVPPLEEVKKSLIEEFQNVLGRRLECGAITADEESEIGKWERKFESEGWLFQKPGKVPKRVKISTDVAMAEGIYKAPGGLIRATITVGKRLSRRRILIR